MSISSVIAFRFGPYACGSTDGIDFNSISSDMVYIGAFVLFY